MLNPVITRNITLNQQTQQFTIAAICALNRHDYFRRTLWSRTWESLPLQPTADSLFSSTRAGLTR